MLYYDEPLNVSDYVIIIPKQINELSIDVELPEYNNKKNFISISNLPKSKNKTVMPKLNSECIAEVIPDGQLSMKFIQKDQAAKHMKLYQFKKKIARFLEKQNVADISPILQQIDEESEQFLPIYLQKFPEMQETITTYLEKVSLSTEIKFGIRTEQPKGIDILMQTIKQIEKETTPMGCNGVTFITTPNYKTVLATKNIADFNKVVEQTKEKIAQICRQNNVENIEISATPAKMLDCN